MSLNTIQKLEGTTGDKDGWNQTLAGSLLGGYAYQYIMGCIFATSVYIPDLEREIIFHLGYHLEDIKDAIVSECTECSNIFRLQRITEIFIEQGERILFPFVDGSYMSHILKI